MNSFYQETLKKLADNPKKWLVTGCAGFIGSNLIEFLLLRNQKVVGLDNFSTGKLSNLNDVEKTVGPELWQNFQFHEGSTVDLDICTIACSGVDYILHQAALGSVPRSIENPLNSHDSNVNGQLNILFAGKESKVKKVVFASSSSVYGDNENLPKIESEIGEQLSPYAVSKHVNELYGRVFNRTYGLETIGLRYFNVFGKRQDPESIYAAVIPKWVKALVEGCKVQIFGDGETSRDFCYIKNVIQMNILAAISENKEISGQIVNCACNRKTSLNDLLSLLKKELRELGTEFKDTPPEYLGFRKGDIRHSQANISKAADNLGYAPEYYIEEGLKESIRWYSNYFM